MDRERPRAPLGEGMPKLDEATLLWLNISGPALMKLVSRRTVRHATIVDATTAGTLNMIDMIGLRLSTMKIVATVLATKAMMK